jgi:hypothetical protein
MRFKEDGSNWRYLALLTVTYRYLALDAVRVFGGMSDGGLGGSIPPHPDPLPEGEGEPSAVGWGSRPSFDIQASIVAVRLCFAAALLFHWKQ